MQIPIKFTGGEIVDCGVTIRPFAREFLALMSQFFEVVIFTASHSCYANMILNLLDPENEFITFRMFRESCIETEEGIFVKDLRIFANRNIEDVLIVDNACYSYAFQINNGVPIVPFFFEPLDTQLIELTNFLLSLVGIKEEQLVSIEPEVHEMLESFFKEE
jgi:CTD small phosphatase-like protein 2